MPKIFNRIENQFKKNLPFVSYKKPNSDTVFGFFQKDDSLNFVTDFNESGFVFAPFDDMEKTVLIPKLKSDFIGEKINLSYETVVNSKKEASFFSCKYHITLVEKALAEIKNKNFDKVVISRKEEVALEKVDLTLIFKNLLLKYPTAMVSIWFHPKVGLWFGATPETLLNVVGQKFETMSLAGTQVYMSDSASNAVLIEEIVWESKEVEEQQLVTDFIKNQLKSISSNLKISEKETIKAGNLVHLRTKISGKITSKHHTLKHLIKALHPTPAVCGLPREVAKKFILNHENYARKFYTGFLGELNLENTSALFVNLRCMEIIDNKAILYVGGGITKDSIPKKECAETMAKSRTIKQVL